MGRTCARPGCNLAAAATYNFDGLARIVWLGPIDEAGRSAGDLCARHADRLRPPLHWELRDQREGAPTRIGLAAEGEGREDRDKALPLITRAFRASKAG